MRYEFTKRRPVWENRSLKEMLISYLIFRYANRAKNIKNKPRVNEDPKDALLREFQQEIARLKAQINNRGGDREEKKKKTKKVKRIRKAKEKKEKSDAENKEEKIISETGCIIMEK